MKQGLSLLSLLAIVLMGAGEAHALTAYVADAPHACASGYSCGKSASSNQIGCFGLAGIAPDQKASRGCSIGAPCRHQGECPVTGLLGLVVNPVAAVLNDAHLLLTMPYRKSERLN